MVTRNQVIGVNVHKFSLIRYPFVGQSIMIIIIIAVNGEQSVFLRFVLDGLFLIV